QYSPRTNAEIGCMIYAGTKGYLDPIDLSQGGRFEEGLLNHLRGKCRDLLDYITGEDPKISGEAEQRVRKALDEYAADFA
ncbi:MAG: F0F1 ATP synthase subunit alpha, partial [Roseovarius sp.]|nr:F0F1 ATP synthase subunit alpha [Roseovarius sp.]